MSQVPHRHTTSCCDNRPFWIPGQPSCSALCSAEPRDVPRNTSLKPSVALSPNHAWVELIAGEAANAASLHGPLRRPSARRSGACPGRTSHRRSSTATDRSTGCSRSPSGSSNAHRLGGPPEPRGQQTAVADQQGHQPQLHHQQALQPQLLCQHRQVLVAQGHGPARPASLRPVAAVGRRTKRPRLHSNNPRQTRTRSSSRSGSKRRRKPAPADAASSKGRARFPKLKWLHPRWQPATATSSNPRRG